MEIEYQRIKYNLSKNSYKEFCHRCESRKFTPEQNHIWLSKMEEIFKEDSLKNNPEKEDISLKKILYFILLSILGLFVVIVLIVLVFNPFILICVIGLLGMTYKMLVK